MIIEELKNEIVAKIKETVKTVYGNYPENFKLGTPPDISLGDFTVECYPLAKQFRTNPNQIAQKIAKEIAIGTIIQKIKAQGAYINIKIKNGVLFETACSDVLIQGSSFGNISTNTEKRIMVEYLSPNTNKPLHLGHVRNGAIGMAISNTLDTTSCQLIKANLVNDRGVHICKSMLAWKKWGKGLTPESTGIKGDHFVGKWYVRYAQEEEKNPHIEEEVQEMLLKWENNDPETVALWEKMNGWVYDGFSKTYENLGLKFDTFYYESDTYKLGKDIIVEGLETGIFSKDERGNTIFTLPDNFGQEKKLEERGYERESKKVTVLRSDGTSLYMTQDIATALLKVKEHNLDQSIYVVGSEQIYHFKCLFEILGSLGYDWAKDCYHLAYGMVYLPEGKMKSREGKVVDADDLIQKVKSLAVNEIKQRDHENKLTYQEINDRADKIASGAIKFYLLRVRPLQDIHFNPEESISFDGFTGPYCQYAYARISGILKNAEKENINIQNVDFSLLGNEEELLLVQKLIQFPQEIQAAGNEFNPSRIATCTFNIAKAFNQLYNKHRVISFDNQDKTKARLYLIKATQTVIKKGLNLLGIDVLENM